MAAIGNYYVFIVMRMSTPGTWIMLKVIVCPLTVNQNYKLFIIRLPNLNPYLKNRLL